MSEKTANEIKKHGSITAQTLARLLAELPPDTPITSMGMRFDRGQPDMRGGFELCFVPNARLDRQEEATHDA